MRGQRFRDQVFHTIHQEQEGIIAWRWATGDNVELTHLKVQTPRKGCGRRLLRAMLVKLKEEPPYHTVFGFTRVGNIRAHAFYRAMGFSLSLVTGVYADGAAMIFSAPYLDLCRKHLEDGDENRVCAG